MPRRILIFFTSELKGVVQSAFLLAFAGFVADILALLRDRLLAAEFGASRSLDIYYVSFRVPDFIYTVSLFFAASTALIPMLLEKFSEDEKKAQDFLENIFSLFLIAVILLVLVFPQRKDRKSFYFQEYFFCRLFCSAFLISFHQLSSLSGDFMFMRFPRFYITSALLLE